MNTWCSNLPQPLKSTTTNLSSYSVSTCKYIYKKHTFIVPKGDSNFFSCWWCCFEFFCRGRKWVSSHHGYCFDFACGMIKPCFILCKNALKYLLSISITWQVHEWLKCNEICDCLWGSLAPSLHTFFCNAVSHEQSVHYKVKSLPLKQLVTLMLLSPLITTSAWDSHPLWTCLGIQIGCLSSTVLIVFSLWKACTVAVPMKLTTSTYFACDILHTQKFNDTMQFNIWPHSHLTCTFQTE